eukprot:m51a1_g10363 putative cathepsin b-like cysteine proteinase (95) ;mRNA; r:69025-69374
MQREIITYGPIEVAFFVFSDFHQYTRGVYTLTRGSKFSGSHAVTIVGWGEEAGVPYWTVANSWGQTWAGNGFFRIRRGTNEAGIESKAATGRVQ